jgi:hypothetical protein
MLNYFCQSFASGYIDSMAGKYDYTISCDEILDMYNMNDLEHMAADEFQYFYDIQGDKTTRKIQPSL